MTTTGRPPGFARGWRPQGRHRPSLGSSTVTAAPSEPFAGSVVVLVSGSGTLLQALVDASADTAYGVRVAAVGADRDGIEGLARAERAGIPTFVCRLTDFPDRAAWDAGVAERRCRVFEPPPGGVWPASCKLARAGLPRPPSATATITSASTALLPAVPRHRTASAGCAGPTASSRHRHECHPGGRGHRYRRRSSPRWPFRSRCCPTTDEPHVDTNASRSSSGSSARRRRPPDGPRGGWHRHRSEGFGIPMSDHVDRGRAGTRSGGPWCPSTTRPAWRNWPRGLHDAGRGSWSRPARRPSPDRRRKASR